MTSSALPDVSFHDAEVVAVRLDRGGPTLEMEVELVAQLPEARVVRLRFHDVTELALEDFNHQNVLFDLRAEEDGGGYVVTLDSSFGLGGSFRCTRIEPA
jgi:hypothetical protein